MKTTFIAAVCAFATGVFAGAQIPGGFGGPVGCHLTQAKAEEIVNSYKSVLENVTYDGLSPYELTQKVLAEDYHEYSDSILSIISANNTLGDAAKPAATTREEWYEGVSRNPSPNIETHDILIAGETNILWYWTFPLIGIAKYPAKGFNLLRIDENCQIHEADIEFNSIAWAVDIFQIGQYCTGAPPASGPPA